MELVRAERPADLGEPEAGNSATALDRLRVRLERAAAAGERQLPPERRLAQDLAVGRAALRRALEVLEAEGQVWRIQGKGTFVGAPPSDHPGLGGLSNHINPVEVMEARLELEPGIARLAALRATPADIEMMRHLARRTASAADADGRELWDGALHRRIAAAGGNRLIIALFDLVDRVRQDESFRVLRERARSAAMQRLYIEQHERIIAAIAARDGAAAEAAMRDHLQVLARRLVECLTAAPAAAAGDDDAAADAQAVTTHGSTGAPVVRSRSDAVGA